VIRAKKQGRGRWIAGALIYLVYLLVFFEASSRIILSVGPLYRRVRDRDDSSFRIDWVRRQGTPKTFAYEFDVYHPTRGWALKPSIRDMAVFDGKILNSNSAGLRGKREYEYRRQPGKQRILVLGDSITFGEEVSDDEAYPHALETLLPDTEVLNLGVHAYGHDQMLLYLKEEGIKYRPDVVILGFVWWDMQRNLLSFKDFAKPKFALRPGGLRLTNLPVPTAKAILEQEPYRSKSLDLLVILREKIWWRFGLNQELSEEVTWAIFDEIVATARGVGAVPVLVYLPVMEEIRDANTNLTSNEQPLFGYCQQRGVACLFLRPRFLEEIGRGVQFKYRGHWNASGHITTAKGIRDYLREKGVIHETRSVSWTGSQLEKPAPGVRRHGHVGLSTTHGNSSFGHAGEASNALIGWSVQGKLRSSPPKQTDIGLGGREIHPSLGSSPVSPERSEE